MSPGTARKWIADRKGSTAVEFAMVAPILLAMIFSIMEAGWYFFVTTSVQQANANAARLIRTGQAQNGDLSSDAFFNEICDVVKALGDCNEKLTIDISKFSTFAALASDLSEPECRDKDDPSISGAQYTKSDFGMQRDIIRVRVCFLYKPINPGLGLNLKQTKHGDRQIVAVSIFRNEPFEGS
ncbi:TadE/TadG family type IV pilus assembly protein [Hyphococcus sp.]|uniref:TadE/TadG family type IV pilus assembly protein n=1 Tax=Hyphococcus sp. TaxID=2038636 RepID=UPI0035C6B6DA